MIDTRTAVVSCVGMFSKSNEEMFKVNGDSNAELMRTASSNGALRFLYVSAYRVEDQLPFKLLPGYFEGKRYAEKAVQEYFPNQRRVVLQPGMVYGQRVQGGTKTPLQYVGAPLEYLFTLPIFDQLQRHKKGQLAFSPAVNVHDVAKTVICGA